MRAADLLLCSTAFVLLVSMLQGQSAGHTIPSQPISGNYVGLEKMDNLSPEDPLIHWYHEDTLFIRNNEFILHKAPLTMRNGKKTYSASDGGFFGRVQKNVNLIAESPSSQSQSLPG